MPLLFKLGCCSVWSRYDLLPRCIVWLERRKRSEEEKQEVHAELGESGEIYYIRRESGTYLIVEVRSKLRAMHKLLLQNVGEGRWRGWKYLHKGEMTAWILWTGVDDCAAWIMHTRLGKGCGEEKVRFNYSIWDRRVEAYGMNITWQHWRISHFHATGHEAINLLKQEVK